LGRAPQKPIAHILSMRMRDRTACRPVIAGPLRLTTFGLLPRRPPWGPGGAHFLSGHFGAYVAGGERALLLPKSQKGTGVYFPRASMPITRNEEVVFFRSFDPVRFRVCRKGEPRWPRPPKLLAGPIPNLNAVFGAAGVLSAGGKQPGRTVPNGPGFLVFPAKLGLGPPYVLVRAIKKSGTPRRLKRIGSHLPANWGSQIHAKTGRGDPGYRGRF